MSTSPFHLLKIAQLLELPASKFREGLATAVTLASHAFLFPRHFCDFLGIKESRPFPTNRPSKRYDLFARVGLLRHIFLTLVSPVQISSL